MFQKRGAPGAALSGALPLMNSSTTSNRQKQRSPRPINSGSVPETAPSPSSFSKYADLEAAAAQLDFDAAMHGSGFRTKVPKLDAKVFRPNQQARRRGHEGQQWHL
jgi:hypothetical protein